MKKKYEAPEIIITPFQIREQTDKSITITSSHFISDEIEKAEEISLR